MSYRYKVVFERDADGGHSAHVPALPGCASQGDTFEEASANIREVIKLYLWSLKNDGLPVPENDPEVLIKTLRLSFNAVLAGFRPTPHSGFEGIGVLCQEPQEDMLLLFIGMIPAASTHRATNAVLVNRFRMEAKPLWREALASLGDPKGSRYI